MSPNPEARLAGDVMAGYGDVEDPAVVLSRRELGSDVLGLRDLVPADAVVAVRASRAVVVAAVVIALDGWASRVDLLGSVESAAFVDHSVVLDDAVLRSSPGASPGTLARPGRAHVERDTVWRLFTSGTSGVPKAVDHTIATLTRTLRPARHPMDSAPPRRWGLFYEPTRMAGLQVVLQSLVAGESLLDATGLATLPDRLRWLASRGVNALSATPTVWRQVLASGRAQTLPLRQVTLGGEIADQGLLDALRTAFPDARVTHVFASTETGVAFAVNDGRAGFPATYLRSPPGGVRLSVRDGILHVYAPDLPTAAPDGFASTGDLVEAAGDRVTFRGRASGVVKVAGVTVSAEEVEDVLRAEPDVADVVVSVRPNPFSGWIVVASVVAAPGAETDTLPARLRATTAARLSAAHVPAAIKLVPELSTTATGKAGRR